jgi:hypothetical protein
VEILESVVGVKLGDRVPGTVGTREVDDDLLFVVEVERLFEVEVEVERLIDELLVEERLAEPLAICESAGAIDALDALRDEALPGGDGRIVIPSIAGTLGPPMYGTPGACCRSLGTSSASTVRNCTNFTCSQQSPQRRLMSIRSMPWPSYE